MNLLEEIHDQVTGKVPECSEMLDTVVEGDRGGERHQLAFIVPARL